MLQWYLLYHAPSKHLPFLYQMRKNSIYAVTRWDLGRAAIGEAWIEGAFADGVAAAKPG